MKTTHYLCEKCFPKYEYCYITWREDLAIMGKIKKCCGCGKKVKCLKVEVEEYNCDH